MATTSSFALTSLTGTVYTYANCYVSANADGTATLTCVAGARLNPGAWVYSTGVHADIYINGQLVGNKVWLFGDGVDYYGSSDYQYASRTLTIGKTHSAQSITGYVVFYEYIDGTNLGSRQTLTPSAVSVAAKTSYSVDFNANGGTNAPASQVKWYGEDLTLSSSTPTRTGYTFKGWALSANGTVAYLAGGTYSNNAAVTLYAVWQASTPTTAPTIGTNVRNSDTQNTISWSISDTSIPITRVYIERSTNGGSWEQVIVYTGTAFSGSSVDATTSPNNYYRYRARSGNSSGNSPYSSASNYTYNTPSAPSNLTAVFDASLHVVLSWIQTGNSQNQVIVENSTDGETWATVDTLAGTSTGYTDTNPPAGTVYYRVKNRANYSPVLTSDASNVAEVLTLAAPNAPTLKAPVSGAVLDMPSSVVLSWVHNPTDGTSQTEATIQYSTNGGSTWTSATVTTSQQYTLDTSSYTANTVITWRVKTKGTYSDYGDYSASRAFNIKQAPSVTITNPASTDGGTISDVPVQAGFTYSDNSGSFASATATVTDSNGAILYQNTPQWSVSGSAYSFNIPVTDFLPANEQTFTLTIVANSTSGLSTTAARVFATDYAEPNPPELSYTINSDDCSVALIVTEGTGASVIATVAVGVFRVDSDGETAIAAVMNSGDSVTDYLPPLDQEFTYRAVSYTSNGLTAQTLVSVSVDSQGRCMFNWGDGFAQSCGFDMDVTWKTSIDHDRALYKVVGLADPVVRTTNRRTKTLSASGVVWWNDDSQLEALQNIPGTVFFREPKGHVIPVVVKVDLTYPKGQPTTSASVSMTQISGGLYD